MRQGIYLICIWALFIGHANAKLRPLKKDTSIDTILLSSRTADLSKVLSSPGNKIVSLKNDGIYFIKKAIEISSDIVLLGNGSTICPVLEWDKYNDNDIPLISFINVRRGEIRDVLFDFNGEKRTAVSRVYGGILILSSSNVLIQNNTFKNGGLSKSAKVIPNSPYITIASQNLKGEVGSVPKKYAAVLGASNNNVVRGNKMLNLNTESRFGIRIVTNWANMRSSKDFKYRASYNIIENNVFEGDFIWNTVELAGGGTVNNKVLNNNVKGRAVNNLDIDKGASNNEISFNIISNAGLPSRYKNDTNVRFSAISVQGTANGYISRSNVVKGNKIVELSNPKTNNDSKYYYSSAIMTEFVDNVVIEGNEISNAFFKDKLSNGRKYGFGIVLHNNSKNVQILRNRISNVNTGLGVNWGKENGDKISIIDNSFDNVESKLIRNFNKMQLNKKSIDFHVKELSVK